MDSFMKIYFLGREFPAAPVRTGGVSAPCRAKNPGRRPSIPVYLCRWRDQVLTLSHIFACTPNGAKSAGIKTLGGALQIPFIFADGGISFFALMPLAACAPRCTLGLRKKPGRQNHPPDGFASPFKSLSLYRPIPPRPRGRGGIGADGGIRF